MTGTRHIIDEFSSARTTLIVDAGEDTFGVMLEIGLTEGELVRRLPDEPAELATMRQAIADFRERGIKEPPGSWILGYVDRLRTALEGVRATTDVTRYLDPADARAIAASLVHYAGEIERRR